MFKSFSIQAYHIGEKKMWRAIRFGGMFKGNRFVTENDVENKIRKINEHFDEIVIDDKLILSSVFNREYDSKLAGLIFLHYDEKHDEKMVKVFREVGIYTHQKVNDKKIQELRSDFDKKQKDFADASFISVGDVVLYSGIKCMVTKIEGDIATVILDILGANIETSVSLKELTKLTKKMD